jgi:hypothetical protein
LDGATGWLNSPPLAAPYIRQTEEATGRTVEISHGEEEFQCPCTSPAKWWTTRCRYAVVPAGLFADSG